LPTQKPIPVKNVAADKITFETSITATDFLKNAAPHSTIVVTRSQLNNSDHPVPDAVGDTRPMSTAALVVLIKPTAAVF